MDVSVIIVNWNTKKLLENCLASIYKFTKDISFEVIVVDNGSTDGSLAMVSKIYPQVNIIPNKDNLGFTRANNQGIKVAKGKYVLLLNSDTYLTENSLKKLIDFAQSKEDFGAVGPLLLNVDKSIQQSAGFFPHLLQVFFWMSFIDDLPFGYLLKPYHIDHNAFYKKNGQVDWVTGAAFFTSKNVITNVGLLDEKIFMYGEEVEWSYRIKKAGFDIYFTPQTAIVHIGRGSSQKIPQRAYVGEYKGIIYFYKKHKSFLALQIVRLFLKIGALARIIIFSAMGRPELAKCYAESIKVA